MSLPIIHNHWQNGTDFSFIEVCGHFLDPFGKREFVVFMHRASTGNLWEVSI